MRFFLEFDKRFCENILAKAVLEIKWAVLLGQLVKVKFPPLKFHQNHP